MVKLREGWLDLESGLHTGCWVAKLVHTLLGKAYYAECGYADCRYAVCRYAKCRGAH